MSPSRIEEIKREQVTVSASDSRVDGEREKKRAREIEREKKIKRKKEGGREQGRARESDRKRERE